MPPTRAEYAKINIACKQLDIDKKTLISDRYGLESSTGLTRQQTADLLIHFKILGWRPRAGSHGSSNGGGSPRYHDARMRKIVALWITLADSGQVKNRSDGALQKYVKRMTGNDNLRWCQGRDLQALIEGLKQWRDR